MLTYLLISCLVVTSQSASLTFNSEVENFSLGLQADVSSDVTQDNDVTRKHDKRPVYFALDALNFPYNFINKFGELAGFEVDLIEAVCAEAGVDCKVVMTEPQGCVYTERDNATGVPEQDMDYSGKALLGRVFDACPHYEMTEDRHSIVDFTLPYLATSCNFAVAKGNPSGFHPRNKDFSKFRIAHVNGHSTNRQCLKRLRKSYDPERLVLVDTIEEAIESVKSGKADVLFSSETNLSGLEVVEDKVSCGGQQAVMIRQGSDVSTWWNSAFRTLWKSGKFNKMCDEAEKQYGEKLRCLSSPDLADAQLVAQMEREEKKKSDKLWVFMASGRSAAYSFLDEDGKLQGFTKDLIDEVCSRAGKDCRFSLISNKECIHRVGEVFYPGRGVQSGWFDSCTGYYNTPERRNSYDFTLAYLDNYAHFQVAPGNPADFDPSKDVSSMVMVHKANAETNDHCLARLGMKAKRVYAVDTKQEAVDALTSGRADVYFTTRLSMSEELQTVGDKFRCDKGGTCMALPKGSVIPQWWDPAMEKFKESGDYAKWCKEASEKFGFEFPCLP